MVCMSGVFTTVAVFSILVMFVDLGSTQSLTQGEFSSSLNRAILNIKILVINICYARFYVSVRDRRGSESCLTELEVYERYLKLCAEIAIV